MTAVADIPERTPSAAGAPGRALGEAMHQQLIRYDALFELLTELRRTSDISEVVDVAAKRWKYVANVWAWRLVLPANDQYLLIDASQGRARVSHISALPPWDDHHWHLQHPGVFTMPLAVAGTPAPPEHLQGPAVSELMVMPFVVRQNGPGLLTIAAAHAPLTDLDRKFIPLLCHHLADKLTLARLQEAAVLHWQSQATRDALTGALNRGAISERLQSVLALAARSGEPLAVVLGDIDHFKAINDTHGHLVGDAVLRGLVERFVQATRASDAFGRFGGEEFLFVLYPCDAAAAEQAAERLRLAVAAQPFAPGADATTAVPVTISLGVACSSLQAGATSTSLLLAADQALYRSKAAGRNAVTVATQTVAPFQAPRPTE